MLVAFAMKMTDLVIECDNASIMYASIDPSIAPSWEAEVVVADIHRLARFFQEISFSTIKRTANKAANWIATMARSNGLPSQWMSSLLGLY